MLTEMIRVDALDRNCRSCQDGKTFRDLCPYKEKAIYVSFKPLFTSAVK